MKKKLKIIFGTITFILISGIIVIYFYLSKFEKKEIIEIYNPSKNEKIFFIRYIWGNDEETAISYERSFSPFNVKEKKTKYTSWSYSPFFYKIERDTLFVYGSDFIKPKENRFKTPIKLIELSNLEFFKLKDYKNYKKQGLIYFPPSNE